MLYAAYGSNTNLLQMTHRCPKSKVIGNSKLVGWKLVFNMHLDIIKTNNKEDVVPLVVWDIDVNDWEYLDMYEGYPNYYVKKRVKIKINNDEKTVIVYVMVDEMKGIAPPIKAYFETCKQGYIDNGIDINYLYEALKYSTDNVTKYNKYNIKELIL